MITIQADHRHVRTRFLSAGAVVLGWLCSALGCVALMVGPEAHWPAWLGRAVLGVMLFGAVLVLGVEVIRRNTSP